MGCLKKVRKPAPRWFEVREDSGAWAVFVQGQIVTGGFRTKGPAESLAGSLNTLVRAVNFKPRSAGGRSRRKGHQFEREVAIRFREIFPEARRHLEYQDQEADGCDLVETGHFRVQCKKLKKYAPIKMIEEVTAQRELGDIPVLVTAGDGELPVAVVYFDDFLCLLRSPT